MSAHTPGPWIKDIFAIYADSGRGEIARERSSGRSVAERVANARLIAASPELLEALEEIAAHSLEFDVDELHYIAKAAIRKAKGEL